MLLILLDAASLSVAPSNQSSSRIRLAKLPAHISPWEQQQWVPKMQLLIAPRHRFYSPFCCRAMFHVGRDNSLSIGSILWTRKRPDVWMSICIAVSVSFITIVLRNFRFEWFWGKGVYRNWGLCKLLSSFGSGFQPGAFQGVETDSHFMWPEMPGSCEQLANENRTWHHF